MSSASSLSNLTPEQRAAGKRIAIVWMAIKGLQSVSLIALMVFLTTSDQYRPRLTAIWGVSTIVVGWLASRICMARLTKIETGRYPTRTPAVWLWDCLLTIALATMLILSW